MKLILDPNITDTIVINMTSPARNFPQTVVIYQGKEARTYTFLDRSQPTTAIIEKIDEIDETEVEDEIEIDLNLPIKQQKPSSSSSSSSSTDDFCPSDIRLVMPMHEFCAKAGIKAPSDQVSTRSTVIWTCLAANHQWQAKLANMRKQ